MLWLDGEDEHPASQAAKKAPRTIVLNTFGCFWGMFGFCFQDVFDVHVFLIFLAFSL